jgi:hypothetical protein
MNSFRMIFLLCCSITLAAQEIITDRPDQTESSSTIQKGNLQIESGLLLEFLGEDISYYERTILAPTTLIRYGLLDFAELRVLSQIESVKNNSTSATGISDLEIGTKLQLLKKEKSLLEIALLSHIIIPTGSKEVSSNTTGSINKLCVSHRSNTNISIAYNLGYNYFGSGKGDLTYSFVLGSRINDKASVYLEPYGEFIEFEDNVININSGITYLLKDNFQLDFSFGTGINHIFNYTASGFSWNIGKN